MNDTHPRAILDMPTFDKATLLRDARNTGALPAHQIAATANDLRESGDKIIDGIDKYYEIFAKKRSARRLALSKKKAQYLQKMYDGMKNDEFADTDTLKRLEKEAMSADVVYKALKSGYRRKHYAKRGK